MSQLRSSFAAAALVALALTGCKTPPATIAIPPTTAGIDWSNAPVFAIAMSDFEFTPPNPKFRRGQPVRLVVVNQGTGRHDFSAPGFFGSITARPGSALPVNGGVSLAAGEKAELDIVPGAAGQYPLECTVFLHAMFGMTGTISVTASK